MALIDSVSARERRVIAGGAALLLVASVLAYGVMPFMRHWREREGAIEAARARVAYLGDLTARTNALEAAATDAERALSSQRRRVLHARSSTLAASALQTFLQEAADASHVVVTRLEVSPDDSSSSDIALRATGNRNSANGDSAATTRLPATLSAYGDITGAATLLNVLMSGPRVVAFERLTLSRNAALQGAPDVVQLTMTMRVPVLPAMTTPSASAPRVRSTRALDVFAAACAVIALVLLVWPTSTGVVATASAREPDTSQAPSAPAVSADSLLASSIAAGPEADSLISAVVNGNVFSATRRAPRTRFVAPGEPLPVAEASPVYGAGRPEVVSDDSLPRLSGIIMMNGERRALLQMVAADESPKLYRINESHAGFRIVQIGPDLVVLASRAGTRTLRLSRGAPPDSLKKQP